LGRALDIDRVKARYHINKAQDDGLVLEYTPVVIPSVFGTPHLVQINFDSNLYKFPEQLEDTISKLIEYLKECIEQLNCITMTDNIDSLVNSLYHEKNIARENITTYDLKEVHGVPMYSEFSSVIDTKPESERHSKGEN
jgi:hypothetical protein